MTALTLDVAVETFPIAGTFTISRGSRREATVVVATLRNGAHTGRGECVPYARYGETVDGVVAAIRAAGPVADRASLLRALPAGAARNALDCALWDLAAKRTGTPALAAAGLTGTSLTGTSLTGTSLTGTGPFLTCYTLSLGSPDDMAAAARAAADKPILKLKLGGGAADAARLAAVRAARPDARLVADANEAWRVEDLAPLLAAAAAAGVELVEQPLPAGADAALADVPHVVPICADESAHTAGDVATLAGRYDAINIKLDKAGGLSEALAMAAAARARGLDIMVGCMVATSLAMAPALALAPMARWLDLDGPLLLARDRAPALRYDGAFVHLPVPDLWG